MWFKDGTEETFPSWVFPVRFLSRAVDKYLFVWRLIDLLKLMDDIWNLSLSFQAFVATGTNLSLQFFPANLHGDQRQVPTREYVDFERETGKVGQVQDTLTLTFTLHLLLCSTTAGEITNFNIRCIWKHLCCLSHALTWLLDSFNTFFQKHLEKHVHLCRLFCFLFLFYFMKWKWPSRQPHKDKMGIKVNNLTSLEDAGLLQSSRWNPLYCTVQRCCCCCVYVFVNCLPWL